MLAAALAPSIKSLISTMGRLSIALVAALDHDAGGAALVRMLHLRLHAGGAEVHLARMPAARRVCVSFW